MPKRETGIIRIHVYELRIGMCVCRLEMLEKESSFLFDRFDIKTQADIQAIQAVCDYVFIDVKRQNEFHVAMPTEKAAPKKQLSFARSLEQSARIYQDTSNLIKIVMDDIRFGNQLSVKAIKEAAAQCVDKVLENSDAMLLLTQLKHQDEYTAQHSLNVCIFAILLGRELNFSGEELNSIGLCALLHDIGKAKIPLEILNKPGKLDDDEREIMRKHPEFGRDILMAAPNIVQDVADVAYDHHENLAGTGYPRGAVKTELSSFAKIVAVVDAYDAITSDRVYQKGKSHLKALDILVKGMNTQFEANLVIQFINCIGFYPQGTVVELSNGEIGIVAEQNKSNQLKPKILLIIDENKTTVNERILDLALNVSDMNGVPYEIKRIVSPQEYGIDLITFYDEGKFTQNYPVIA
ncbi:MAG: HD-GYP domain-containing protein [Moraxellaceae bacterium]|nr:HD-GYP domain-containing protein [Moraxellaceae bacterium]